MPADVRRADRPRQTRPVVHQVAYLVDHGVPALVGATVVGVVGVCSVAGKAGWGTLSDRIGREPTYTLAFLRVAASVGLLAVQAGDVRRVVVSLGPDEPAWSVAEAAA